MDTGRSAARRARALRGTVAAAVATTIAATAHTLSGGGAPPLWLLLAVTALAAPLSVALVGQRPHVARLSTAVIAAQAVLHFAFASIGTSAPAALGDPRGAHDHSAMLLPSAGTEIGATATATATAAMTTTMMIGHVLAAVTTIVLLAFGERMLKAIARGIRQLLPLLPTPAAPRPAVRAAASASRTAVSPASFLTSVTRRGPPALAC